MHEIVFATNNIHKLDEIRAIIDQRFKILSLAEIGCNEDIPETGETLEENALQKARYVKQHYGYDCFADDTGLMVDALGGAPGVRSARYAGDGHDSEANMSLLLKNMDGQQNRRAHFATVIALIYKGKEVTFEGRVDGEILTITRGDSGFGYDPVFMPLGFEISFAEMSKEEKNEISHRGRATALLIDYFEENQ